MTRYSKRQRAHVRLTITSVTVLALAACQSGGMPPALRNEWNAATCLGEEVTGSSAEQRAATAALQRALDEDHGAGATAAVIIDGRLVWSEAIGRANDAGDPLTPSAQIRIGSVAKGFTAAMLARLFERGEVALDAPIQNFVPSFPRKSHDITLRQLATHTSGARQYDFSNMSEANNTIHYATLSDALGLFANDPLVSQPGAAVHYSSFGYNLIGVAIENIESVTYEQALQSTVSEPLGLRGVALDEATRPNPCRPHFYTNAFGRISTGTIWRDSSDYYPSGGLVATSEDMARFAYALFATDAFTPEARALFTERPRLADGTLGAYGFAWQVQTDANGEVEWYGLGGAANGAHASVRYYPRLRMAAAGAINYNFFLTERSPTFFRAIRQEIPAIYGAGAE